MTAYILTALLCVPSSDDCATVRQTVRPGRFDLMADWCGRYADQRMAQLALGFTDDTAAEVRSDVLCEVAE